MYSFKDLAGLTRITVAALAIYMVAELVFGLMSLYLYWTIETGVDLTMVGLVGVGAIVMILALIVCVVLVACWTYRASANAHTFSDEMTITPGWAVGWYFIPIANLFKPFQGMRELWLASHFRGNWHGEPTPPQLTLWWGLWIVTNILGNVSFRMSMMDEGGQLLGMTTMIDVAVAVLNVPLCLVLIKILREVARAQTTAPYNETFA
jgi:uncharacterized protein DUF4328